MNVDLGQLTQYVLSKSDGLSQTSLEIIDYTQKNYTLHRNLSGKVEMNLIRFLLQTIGARRVLEIGTFTGLSALCMAEVLPEDGEVVTIDVNKKTTTVARGLWEKSFHGKKIKALNGWALDVLNEVSGNFDFIYIDADKRNYINYFEHALKLLSKDGLIVVDNCLRNGDVLKEKVLEEDKSIDYIREFNNHIHTKENIIKTLLPLGDGLFIIKMRNHK